MAFTKSYGNKSTDHYTLSEVPPLDHLKSPTSQFYWMDPESRIARGGEKCTNVHVIPIMHAFIGLNHSPT